jgi:outer membrane protein W
MTNKTLKTLCFLCAFFFITTSAKAFDYMAFNKTVGGNLYGSFQMADTLPVVDFGFGGGIFFDYRFNERFSFMIESVLTFQDGKDRSNGEGSIVFYGVPAFTFKCYVAGGKYRLDPYIGIGVGLYGLTEGSTDNNTGGLGLGAQIELGGDYLLSDNFLVGAGLTFREVGIINSLSGNANATAYMPLMIFGRIGYRF